jgi:hypothetical protein
MAAAGTRRRLLYRNTICFGGKRAAPAHPPSEASPSGISFRDGSKSSPLRAFGRNPLGRMIYNFHYNNFATQE